MEKWKTVEKDEYVNLEKGGTKLFKAYPLSDFMDEESTLDKLKDFENFCSRHNVKIKPTGKST